MSRNNMYIAAAAILAGASIHPHSAFTPPASTPALHVTSTRHSNHIHHALNLKTATHANADTDIDEPETQTRTLPLASSTSTSVSPQQTLLGLGSDPLRNNNQPPTSQPSPSEFELALGKAMDTLREDYPRLLTHSPDFSIYHPDVEVVDPSGFTLHNVKDYKRSFNLVHMIVKLFYCPNQSSLTFRLVYDCARKNIRISWNAVLVPRLFGGTDSESIRRNQLHVDGISVYELDRESGLINQHRVEHLLVNDAPVIAPQGIFQAIANEATQGPEGIPVWNVNRHAASGHTHGHGSTQIQTVLEFTSDGTRMLQPPASMLFSSSSSSHDDSEGTRHTLFNEEAFLAKNESRKKFGLKPISPDEFIQIAVETQELEQNQRQKAAAAAQAAAEMAPKPKQQSFLNKLFGNVLQDTCESNYDCERPEVCCDFGFRKQCCKSGLGVTNLMPGQQKLERIPIRVVADDGRYPQGGPGGDGMGY